LDFLDVFTETVLAGVPVKPLRAGVAKGTPYGFSRQKALAALLHLRLGGDLNLEGLAREAGISYSLLTKWRTERPFRNLVKRCQTHFAIQVFRFCTDYIGAHVREEGRLEPHVELLLGHLRGYRRWAPEVRLSVGELFKFFMQNLVKRREPDRTMKYLVTRIVGEEVGRLVPTPSPEYEGLVANEVAFATYVKAFADLAVKELEASRTDLAGPFMRLVGELLATHVSLLHDQLGDVGKREAEKILKDLRAAALDAVASRRAPPATAPAAEPPKEPEGGAR
jgi:hypothetical protein